MLHTIYTSKWTLDSIILGKEILLLNYLSVQKPVRTGFVLNNRNTSDINCVFKRLQPLHYCSRGCEPSISINSIIDTQRILYHLLCNIV